MSQPSVNVGTNGSGSTLQGLFKQQYSKNVVTAIPEFAILQKLCPFNKAQLLGDFYHVPIILSDETGFTYGGSTGANYTLNSAIAMQMQDAKVQGSEITLQSGISVGAVSRAEGKGEQAVEGAVSLLIERMKASHARRVEISMLYGQSITGLGVISATSGSGTTRTYTISSPTWATGIFAGMENTQLDAYYNTGTTGVQLNTNAAIVITSVSVANKTVSVSGSSSDLTSLDAQVGSTAGTAATFYFYGAYGNEMIGLDVIMNNSASTLFNISASTYNLWAGNQYGCGSAQLTMGKVLTGLAAPVGRGLMESVTLLIAPDSFLNLVADLSAQRRYDGSYKSKKADNGVESLEFHFQGGSIDVVSHPMVKAGDAFAFCTDHLKRVGSSDVTFKGQMVGGEEQFIVLSQTANSWLTRSYCDQAIILELPAQSVKYTGIVATT